MKERSLFMKLVDIHWEQAKRRKALRNMEKLSWSLDFLSLMLAKAAKSAGEGMSIAIVNKDGIRVELSYNDVSKHSKLDADDNIFDRLDDDAAVDDFIRRNSVR